MPSLSEEISQSSVREIRRNVLTRAPGPVHALSGPIKYTPLKWSLPLLALVTLIVTTAYSPILFDWFVGDDYVHLIWLKEAIHNSELVLRNFHANWLDVQTTKFYRPLISVFMLTDYSVWGANGLGFHLTNLAFLLFSCVAIFFITKSLLRNVRDARGTISAFAASLLFGLYPLHAEPVSWITGRVDAVVAAFYLGALWCYMRWRESDHKGFLALSLLTMTLALMSKEMAITLPATFAAYELSGLPAAPSMWLKRISNSFLKTLPFWGLLAAYFVVRRISLGTFVGGYDDSLGVPDLHKFIMTWAHSLSMLLAPANRELMTQNNLFLIGWKVCLSACAGTAAWNLYKTPSLRAPAFFLLAWFALSLAPVYRLFSIADDLQGSRLAYLCTAPLVCLLALAFAKFELKNTDDSNQSVSTLASTKSMALALLLLAFPVCGFAILQRNNSAWASAGATSNAVRASLRQFYQANAGDPQLLLVGVPDNIHGAYVVRNALDGMTKTPQLDRDIKNCLAVQRTEQILPFGYLKDSIPKSGAIVLYWNNNDSRLVPINSTSINTTDSFDQVSAKELSRRIAPLHQSCEAQPVSNGVSIHSGSPGRWQEISISMPALNCFNTDFLVVELSHVSAPKSALSDVDLFYTNTMIPEVDNEHRAHNVLRLDDTGKVAANQQLLFRLRSQPDWTLGGRSDRVVLRLPGGVDAVINTIRRVPARTLFPAISIDGTDYSGSKGFIHLNRSNSKMQLGYDAASVPGAAAVVLEIGKANQFFEDQNSETTSQFKLRETILPRTAGNTTIASSLFPVAGLYELRAWAIDSNNHKLGLAGDHIVVSVE